MNSISCDKLIGTIRVNPSKSHFIRLLLTAMVYGINLEVINPCRSDDCIKAIAILRKIGCKIFDKKQKLIINCKDNTFKNNLILNCGESATLFRMLAAILLMLDVKAELIGSGSLVSRDFSDIAESLNNLQVEFDSDKSKLPFKINSGIKVDKLIVDSGKSSQFLSGLLISLAKSNFKEIYVRNLVSKSYIDLTLNVLESFGIFIENDNYHRFELKEVRVKDSVTIECEGDWSGASYWLVACAIGADVVVEGLYMKSKQGDKKIIEILEKVGAKIKIEKNKLYVGKKNLLSFVYDAKDTPDLIPALIPLGLCCDGESIISGANRLVNKESNRLFALISEYKKLGASIRYENDKIFMKNSKLIADNLSSHNDHRIAMSLIVSSLLCDGEMNIDNLECLNKSYPKFLQDFKKLGGKISE